MNERAFVSVADILPFWRYAVGPASGNSPAVPFYALASAVAFFDEAKRELPWAGVALYRRRLFCPLETIQEYRPTPRDVGLVSDPDQPGEPPSF